MLEALVIFSGFPFLFLVSVAISPPSAEHVDFYDRFSLISRLAFVAYCLLPLYLIASIIIEVAPRSPVMFTLDNVFELLLFFASTFLGWTFLQLAEAARKRAYSQAISRSLGPYIEPSSELKSDQPIQPAQSLPPSKKNSRVRNKSKE